MTTMKVHVLKVRYRENLDEVEAERARRPRWHASAGPSEGLAPIPPARGIPQTIASMEFARVRFAWVRFAP